MAKKKKSKGQATQMSPERYIKERVRLLPIDKCLVNTEWQENGLAHIAVMRRHPMGTHTVGFFLVDTFCKGVYDAFYRFSIDDSEIDDLYEKFSSFGQEMEEVDYSVAHNIIYGAIAFAEEAGIMPCKEFNIVKYILEDDTDDVPLIEYEFGRNGKHFLLAKNQFEANQYLPLLRKNLGDNFDYTIAIGDDYDDEEEDEDDDESWLTNYGMEGEYCYQHPEYPSTIELQYPWVEELLSTEKKYTLSKEELDKILALPHEQLRHDLEQMALYEIGRNVKGEYRDTYNPLISHIILLLAAIDDERSLDVVFEIMRQDKKFMEYHYSDCTDKYISAPLYHLARHNLRRILEYLKEEGLYEMFRFDAIVSLIEYPIDIEPERRDEVLGYARELIAFLIDHADDPHYMSGEVAGRIVWCLMDMNATELLPDIEALYATSNVAIGMCGKIENVRKKIKRPVTLPSHAPFNIYATYEDLEEWLGFVDKN